MSDDLYWRRLHREIERARRARLHAQCQALRSSMASKARAKKRELLEREQAERQLIEQKRKARRERIARATQPRSNVLTFTPPERHVPRRTSPQLCLDLRAPVVRVDFQRSSSSRISPADS